MNIETLRSDINAGKFDSNLESLMSAVQERLKITREQTARQNAIKLSPGSTAITSGLSPKRINGEVVTITKIYRTRADVTFNNPSVAREYPRGAKIPLSSLTPTGETAPAPAAAAAQEPVIRRYKIGKPIGLPEGMSPIDKATSDWEAKYLQEHDVISFPVLDNYAHYEVRGDTLHHLQFGDAYRVHPALLRGLTQDDVNRMLNLRRSGSLIRRSN